MSPKRKKTTAPSLTKLAGLTPGPGDPRGAARSLRQILCQKVERLTAKGDLDREESEELAKIAASLTKLERSGFDLRAAACEIIGRLASFVSAEERQKERRAWLADVLARFLAELEGEQ